MMHANEVDRRGSHGSAGQGSRCSGAGDCARGSRLARAASSRLQVPRPPGARLAARPRPSPQGALRIGPCSCQSGRRAQCSPRPRPGPKPVAVRQPREVVRGSPSVRTGPRGLLPGGLGSAC